MPSPDLLVAFFVAASVFAYMPGPSSLYVAAQTIARGRKAGWLAVFGVHLGGYLHVLAAAVGLAFLFQVVPVLYAGLKGIGAAYLIYLGVRMCMLRRSALMSEPATVQKSPKRAFWESAAVEVLNPKTAIFYIAFLPQFVDPAAALAIGVQLLILGTLVNIMFSSADFLCVVLADRVMTFFQSSASAGVFANRLGGSILIGLGLHLALGRS